MDQPSFQKELLEIEALRAFERLESFQDASMWSKMTEMERGILAHLFFLQGESQLKSQINPSSSFSVAAQITPTDPKIFIRFAQALFEYGNTSKELLFEASKAIEHSIALESSHTAWFLWAKILMRIGDLIDDYVSFYEADRKFQEAYRMYEGSLFLSKPVPLEPEFFWAWAHCWHTIAKLFGEAGDFHHAIQKYKKALEMGMKGLEFWNDYGNALVDLACLVSRKEFLLEAVEYYRKTVKESSHFFFGWFNLSCTYFRLYQLTEEDRFFHFAHACFERASDLNSAEASLWFKWGQLLVTRGKSKRRKELIQSSFAKFEKANALSPNNAQVLTGWSEALLIVGGQKERLDLLKEAMKKIEQSLELEPETARSWFLLGNCLSELGRYFSDTKYYFQAIEKYRSGLSIAREDSLLWYGLAQAHFAIGEMEYEPLMVEKATRYCARVIEFGGEECSQFWNDWGIALMKLAEMHHDPQLMQEALEKFEQAIRRHCDKEDPSTIDPQWLYHYGCALDFIGDIKEDERYYEKSVKILSQVLVLDPNFTHARYNLAVALCHLGEATSDIEALHKADEHFQAILANDSEDDVAWSDWGVALIHLAQMVHDLAHPEQSLKLFQQAESKLLTAAALGNLSVFYNLACLYSLTGNYVASLHYLERADLCGTLPATSDILEDEWLDGIRDTPEFMRFINELKESNDPLNN